MFTGLIEDVGVITQVQSRSGGAVIGVETALPLEEVRVGDSIAVDGACLTVTACQGKVFHADASPETLECTTLGDAQRGRRVNLERALRLGDRLGGHLVTGHVDSQARVLARERHANMEVFRFEPASGVLALVVAKGSITVDGISLTVNEVGDTHFSVAIIPHTLGATTLLDRRAGDLVNIETDLIGKYVARLLKSSPREKEASSLDVEFLARHGFV